MRRQGADLDHAAVGSPALGDQVGGSPVPIEIPIIRLLDRLAPGSGSAHVLAHGSVGRTQRHQLRGKAEQFESPAVGDRHPTIRSDHQEALIHTVQGRLEECRLLGQLPLGPLQFGDIREDAEQRTRLRSVVGGGFREAADLDMPDAVIGAQDTQLEGEIDAAIDRVSDVAGRGLPIFGMIERGGGFDTWREGVAIEAVDAVDFVGPCQRHRRKRDLPVPDLGDLFCQFQQPVGLARLGLGGFEVGDVAGAHEDACDPAGVRIAQRDVGDVPDPALPIDHGVVLAADRQAGRDRACELGRHLRGFLGTEENQQRPALNVFFLAAACGGCGGVPGLKTEAAIVLDSVHVEAVARIREEAPEQRLSLVGGALAGDDAAIAPFEPRGEASEREGCDRHDDGLQHGIVPPCRQGVVHRDRRRHHERETIEPLEADDPCEPVDGRSRGQQHPGRRLTERLCEKAAARNVAGHGRRGGRLSGEQTAVAEP